MALFLRIRRVAAAVEGVACSLHKTAAPPPPLHPLSSKTAASCPPLLPPLQPFSSKTAAPSPPPTPLLPFSSSTSTASTCSRHHPPSAALSLPRQSCTGSQGLAPSRFLLPTTLRHPCSPCPPMLRWRLPVSPALTRNYSTTPEDPPVWYPVPSGNVLHSNARYRLHIPIPRMSFCFNE